MNEMDVLGLSLEDALRILERKGIAPLIRFTGSDGSDENESNRRVVKLSACDEQWTITVCNVPDAFR